MKQCVFKIKSDYKELESIQKQASAVREAIASQERKLRPRLLKIAQRLYEISPCRLPDKQLSFSYINWGMSSDCCWVPKSHEKGNYIQLIFGQFPFASVIPIKALWDDQVLDDFIADQREILRDQITRKVQFDIDNWNDYEKQLACEFLQKD